MAPNPVLLLSLCLSLPVAFCGVHPHHSERVEDGAFAPRDAHHGHGDNHDSSFDHEAILGSAKEAAEFGHLSPEEAKKRLQILLGKMDLNSDSHISKTELKQWILRSFRALSEEESTERFIDYDTDKNGAVTWIEYLAEEFDADDQGDAKEEEEKLRIDPDKADEYKLLEEDKVLFNAADKNRDGVLDTAEFLAFSHPEEVVEMHQIVVDQVMAEKDKDGNGMVSFQEYMGDRGADHPKDWLMQEKDRFDKELDKNHDGGLDRVEVLAWMIPSNEEIAEDEATHLFAGSDDDVDGQLSFAEVLEHHDLFVGSEVTDYGEHLENIHKFQDEL